MAEKCPTLRHSKKNVGKALTFRDSIVIIDRTSNKKGMNMKKSIIMLALAIGLGATLAEAKGQVEEKEVKVGSFDKISTLGSIDVVYSQGQTHSVVIVGERSVIEKVTVDVRGGKLMIEPQTEKKNVGGMTVKTSKLKGDVKVKVTSKDLREVMITGSGDFEAATNVVTSNITLTVSGSGDMEFKKIEANAAKVSIAGSGDVKVKQMDAKSLNASIAGSGEVEIDKVTAKCDAAKLSIAGSGEMKARFDGCKALECKIAGSGDIELEGKVVDYTSSISGSGRIDKEKLTITGKTSESDSRKKANQGRRRTASGIDANP